MAWRTSTGGRAGRGSRAAAWPAWRVQTASGEPSGVQMAGVLGCRLGRAHAQDRRRAGSATRAAAGSRPRAGRSGTRPGSGAAPRAVGASGVPRLTSSTATRRRAAVREVAVRAGRLIGATAASGRRRPVIGLHGRAQPASARPAPRVRGAGHGCRSAWSSSREAGVGWRSAALVGHPSAAAQEGRHAAPAPASRRSAQQGRGRRCRAGAGRCTSSCGACSRASSSASAPLAAVAHSTPPAHAQASSNSIRLMRSSST